MPSMRMIFFLEERRRRAGDETLALESANETTGQLVACQRASAREGVEDVMTRRSLNMHVMQCLCQPLRHDLA